MALQTRLVDLFRGNKKAAGETHPPEAPLPTAPDVGVLRSESKGNSEPAPRRSMTQYIARREQSSAEPPTAAEPAGPAIPFRAWDRAAGADAVRRWLEQGAGSAGARALNEVMQRCGDVGRAERWERIGDVHCVVAGLLPMVAVMDVASVRQQLLAVGLPPTRPTELRTLLLAFIQLEAAGRDVDLEWTALAERACQLRAELVAACGWNLRGERVTTTLARVTRSADVGDLCLDLTELAELVEAHEAAFTFDTSFDARQAAEQALGLACKLRAITGHRTCSATGERELSVRVFSLLMDTATEVQAAGAYGLRYAPHWARAFGPLWNVCRPRSQLRAALL